MTQIEIYKIWFPYEVFYMESMLTITGAAMRDIEQLEKLLSEYKAEYDHIVVDLSQNILRYAAAISRYFWPSTRNKMHKLRGQRLREAFEITETNPIRERSLRDFIEHFDEKLDIFLNGAIAGTIIPTYVGNRPDSSDNICFFRAYFTNEGIFNALNQEYSISSAALELIRIHNLLVNSVNDGGRLPN